MYVTKPTIVFVGKDGLIKNIQTKQTWLDSALKMRGTYSKWPKRGKNRVWQNITVYGKASLWKTKTLKCQPSLYSIQNSSYKPGYNVFYELQLR